MDLRSLVDTGSLWEYRDKHWRLYLMPNKTLSATGRKRRGSEGGMGSGGRSISEGGMGSGGRSVSEGGMGSGGRSVSEEGGIGVRISGVRSVG